MWGKEQKTVDVAYVKTERSDKYTPGESGIVEQ